MKYYGGIILIVYYIIGAKLNHRLVDLNKPLLPTQLGAKQYDDLMQCRVKEDICIFKFCLSRESPPLQPQRLFSYAND